MKRLLLPALIICYIGLVFKFPDRMISPGSLSEGHQEIRNNCLACHTPFQGLDNNKCISCHKLSDIGRDSMHPNNKILFHQSLQEQHCTSCHSDHHGLNASSVNVSFQHDLLSTPVKSNCISCHAKPVDTLHTKLSEDCKSCHVTKTWKDVNHFDHLLILDDIKNNCVHCHQKPIDNVHPKFPSECKICHNTTDWKSIQAFNHNLLPASVKSKCTDCHASPKDNYHNSFKENCDKCHTTSKWKPSTFKHDNYFRFDGNHPAKCITCHTTTDYKKYTCYGCHEHTESKIRGEHLEEGISNYQNCVRCHKSGNEHDIRNGGSDGETQYKRESRREDDDD